MKNRTICTSKIDSAAISSDDICLLFCINLLLWNKYIEIFMFSEPDMLYSQSQLITLASAPAMTSPVFSGNSDYSNLETVYCVAIRHIKEGRLG